ncbi:MAG: DUF4258 domain-containing protein [Anaerolineales bacterium]|nr:DUF4258 domain-containing protein [Anaerolineales bacterium]
MNNPAFIYRVHAAQRMFERKISMKRLRQVFETGETIEDYSDDATSPSRLILGWEGKRPIHLVVSESADKVVIITAYSPEPELWTKDFKRRR